MSATVTYIDFGTRHLHLAAPDQETALCGLRAGRLKGDPEPGVFDDRPDFCPTETCKRCLASTQQIKTNQPQGEGR